VSAVNSVEVSILVRGKLSARQSLVLWLGFTLRLELSRRLLLLLLLRLLLILLLLLQVRLLLHHIDNRLLVLSYPSNHVHTGKDCACLGGLSRWFVEAGEDGEGEGGGGEEKDEADLDQEVAFSSLKTVTVVVNEGDDQRRKCTQVEEGGEDCQHQERPLLALVGATGSGHPNDASHKAWNGDPKSLPDVDSIRV